MPEKLNRTNLAVRSGMPPTVCSIVPELPMDFVVSYPKSGNYWIRLVAAAYGTEVAPEDLVQLKSGDLAELKLTDIDVRHYQSVSPVPVSDIGFTGQVRLRPAAMFLLVQDAALLESRGPLLVQSHHISAQVNGITLWHSEWADRVVNPVRDPREICCSHAAHFGNSYEETAQLMADPNARTGPGETPDLQWFTSTWSTHVRSWLTEDDIPVHTVRYEDLKADPVGEFYDVFDFLGVSDLDVEVLEDAVATTRFDRLQKAEKEQGAPAAAPDQEQFFRSGQTDGWKQELPVEVARKIEEDHGEMMEKLGYL